MATGDATGDNPLKAALELHAPEVSELKPDDSAVTTWLKLSLIVRVSEFGGPLAQIRDALLKPGKIWREHDRKRAPLTRLTPRIRLPAFGKRPQAAGHFGLVLAEECEMMPEDRGISAEHLEISAETGEETLQHGEISPEDHRRAAEADAVLPCAAERLPQ